MYMRTILRIVKREPLNKDYGYVKMQLTIMQNIGEGKNMFKIKITEDMRNDYILQSTPAGMPADYSDMLIGEREEAGFLERVMSLSR